MSLKILWEANSPTCGTGYGVVTKHVCTRLVEKGFKIVVLANWGVMGAPLDFKGLSILPAGFQTLSEDVVPLVLSRVNPDIMIGLLDIWAAPRLPEIAQNSGVPYVSQSPCDAEPIPEPIEIPSKKSYRVIAISKCSLKFFLDLGVEATYIPHGVDTNVYRPLDKEETRQKLGFRKDDFILFNVAMNKGTRKNFDGLFYSFSIFLENNPDAKRNTILLLHTQKNMPGGADLLYMIRHFGIEQNVFFTDDFDAYAGLSEERMAELYNSADVFILPTKGEGFGIPVLEAESCGTPCIVSRNTSMPELVEGHGWLVDCDSKEWNPLGAWWSIPNPFKMAEAIAEAYSGKNLKKYGEKARIHALKYDWNTIIEKYWIPFLDEIADDLGVPKGGEGK